MSFIQAPRLCERRWEYWSRVKVALSIHSLIPPCSHPPVSTNGSGGRSMRCSRGTAVPGNIGWRITAGNGDETSLPPIECRASNFKGDSAKGFRRRDIMASTIGSFFCVQAAVHGLDIEFSRTREGHLECRPGKQARSWTRIPPSGSMSRAGKKARLRARFDLSSTAWRRGSSVAGILPLLWQTARRILALPLKELASSHRDAGFRRQRWDLRCRCRRNRRSGGGVETCPRQRDQAPPSLRWDSGSRNLAMK
jgi:hypothetical protein